MNWCAAQQNWDRIHYDEAYAKRVAGLPERVVNGALKQHLLVQFLERAFGPRAWVWRLDFSFVAPDLVGDVLEVRGRVSGIRLAGTRRLATVEALIWNVDRSSAGTRASAVVVLDACAAGAGPQGLGELPAELRLDTRIAPASPECPAGLAQRHGTTVDEVESAYPLDHSRLRLFADAVGDVDPVHYDAASAAARGFERVFATPLFAVHAIERAPGNSPLSEDPLATGREGSSEAGRNMAARLGIRAGSPMNGGSSVEIHSRLAVGERVRVRSTLAGVRWRERRGGGVLLIVESLNEYRVADDDRLLLIERAKGVYTDPAPPDGDAG